MNILLIGSIPPKYGGKDFGGIATHIQGLSESLLSKGHKVFLWNYKPQEEQVVENLSVLGNGKLSYFLALFFGMKTVFTWKKYLTFSENVIFYYQKFRLKRIFSENKFDVIHVHSLHNTAPIIIREIAGRQIKVITTDHGFWQKKDFLDNTIKNTLKLKMITEASDKVIYISNFSKEMHLKYSFDQYQKLIKIHNPVKIKSVNFDKIKRLEGSAKKVIFFNGLTESIIRKRLDLVLKAVQNDSFLRENTKVIAIANKAGNDFIESHKFDFDIQCFGAIPISQVDELYNQSDIMVLPSTSESFGLVYIEALIKGIPVIGFDYVIKEFEKEIGCYIGESYKAEINDENLLGKKIKKAFNSNFDSLRVQDTVAKLYSWENMILEFENLYKND